MSATWVVAAIALAAAAFMLRFLVALLHESTPSVCYWVVPARLEPGRALSCRYVEDDGSQVNGSRQSECYAELLENGHYASKELSSGLIALDIRLVSDGLGERSVHPGRGDVFRERQF